MWDPHFPPILAHLRLLHDFLYAGAKLDVYIYHKLGVPSLLVFLVLFVGLAPMAVLSAVASQTATEGQTR